MTSDAGTWDHEYEAGRWRYLGEPREQARLAIAALYVRLFGPGAVLDVGCGSGQLHRHLDPRSLRRYTGVDFSRAALDAARLDPAAATLVQASAEAYAPASGERFDAILFNEVVYFLADPMAEMRRYAGFLAPAGVLIVSITRARPEGGSWDRKIDAFWHALDASGWPTLDEVFLGHRASGNTWRIRALRPGAGDPAG